MGFLRQGDGVTVLVKEVTWTAVWSSPPCRVAEQF